MKAKPKEWIPEQAATIVMDIIQASSEQLWDGEELIPWDCIVALTAAALEATRTCQGFSSHHTSGYTDLQEKERHC